LTTVDEDRFKIGTSDAHFITAGENVVFLGLHCGGNTRL
jgi:hypothetical protein